MRCNVIAHTTKQLFCSRACVQYWRSILGVNLMAAFCSTFVANICSVDHGFSDFSSHRSPSLIIISAHGTPT